MLSRSPCREGNHAALGRDTQQEDQRDGSYEEEFDGATGRTPAGTGTGDAQLGGRLAGHHRRPARAGAAIGSACAYYTKVSLFGGPSTVRGCGQTIPPGNAGSASPSVTLPPGGSGSYLSATDANGAMGVYGPAVIFGGHFDANDNVGPSGQLSTSTIGNASLPVISTAQTGAVGPAPFHADSVLSRCTATTSNTRSYLVQLSNAVVETSTDANGYPLTWVNVPASPPVNHTVVFTLNHIGDHGIVVFNERINNADGSTTLNAVHMYLQGPIAVGDMVIGQTTCGH